MPRKNPPMPRKNGGGPCSTAPGRRASMRPRPDAAEKLAPAPLPLSAGPASMRPRPDAAEKPRRGSSSSRRRRASMRPRPDAAEKPAGRTGADARPGAGFNEAAARCRGKTHALQRGSFGDALASMRPRPDAAEKRVRCQDAGGARAAASMRPRPDAAEKLMQTAIPACPHGASMRPRPDAAEKRRRDEACRDPYRCFNEAAARCRGKTGGVRPEAHGPCTLQ